MTTPLWTFTGNNQTNYLAADVDGDGQQDLIHPLDSGFEIDDPLTGTEKYSLASMGPSAYFYLYETKNVDGMPGDEIIAFDTSYQYSPQTGVYVLGVRSGALTTIWSDTVASTNPLDADTYSVAGSAVDLDGDGSLELVYSRWSVGSQSWSTKIVDAASGSLLATLSGQFLQAIADVDGNGKLDLVVRANVTATQTPPRSTVEAYAFANRAAGAVAKSWSTSGARVLTVGALQRPGPWAGLPVAVTADFDTSFSGAEVLVAQDATGHGDDTQYGLLRGTDGTITHTVPVTATVEPSALGWGAGLTSSTSANDVAMFTADGVVHLDVEHSLRERDVHRRHLLELDVRERAPQRQQPALARRRRTTTYSGSTGLTFTPTSRRTVVFDETSVFQNSASSGTGFPLDPVVLLAGSSTYFVSFETTQTSTSTAISIVAHDPTGIEIWRSPLPAGAQTLSPGAYTVDLTGDGFPDVVLSVFSASAVESPRRVRWNHGATRPLDAHCEHPRGERRADDRRPRRHQRRRRARPHRTGPCARGAGRRPDPEPDERALDDFPFELQRLQRHGGVGAARSGRRGSHPVSGERK